MWSRNSTEAADSRPPLMLGKGRLEALSDGVFSIAMTLLVLELKVPEAAHQHSNAELLEQIFALRTAFLSYVLTFLISGAFWYLHHLTFHFIRHTDRVLCWINLLFLMFVSLLPFSAGLLGHLTVHPVSQFFYFGNQLILAILLNVHWHYARHRDIMTAEAHPAEVRRLTWRIASLAAGFTAALVGAVFEPVYSAGMFAAAVLVTRLAQRLTR